MIHYSVIVPVYNSQRTLPTLLSRITTVFKAKKISSYEIICVDDGSIDDSWKTLKAQQKRFSKLKAIKLMKNFGQHSALLCGFNYCNGRYIITLDDDLQNPPEEIPKLIKAIKNNNIDCVIGKPIYKKHSFYRNFGSYLVGLMYSLVFKKPIDLKMSSFRIIDRKVVDEILKMKIHNPAIDSMILTITSNISNVDVKHTAAPSRYSLYSLIKLAVETVISYSVFPLRFISTIGFTTSLVSLFGILFFVYKKITQDAYVLGWTSLIILNLFFFGLLLLSMGVIGEYLIRIVKQVTLQQPYLVREEKL